MKMGKSIWIWLALQNESFNIKNVHSSFVDTNFFK